MTQYICDWSHWQGDLDAAAVEKEGFAAVKLKVGGAIREGWSYLDPKFLGNATRLRTDTPGLGRIAYWYCMPGNPVSQIGLLIDTLEKAGGLDAWHAQLDIEQDGLAWDDVWRMAETWKALTDNTPFSIYTRRTFWLPRIDAGSWLPRKGTSGGSLTPLLEEAHWVPEMVRLDPKQPYASQQAHSVNDAWWEVDYSGWTQATFLQFTNHVLVAGRTTDASLYRGTRAELMKVLGQ